MKKIFRMANAELNKIFMRPSMFVLFSVLVVALVISSFIFNPISVNKKYTYQLNSITNIYVEFEKDHESLENELISAKTSIDEYLSSNNDTLGKMQNLFQTAKNQFTNNLYVAVVEMPKNQEYPSSTVLSEIKYNFGVYREAIENIKDFMLQNVQNKETNFFITSSDFDELYKKVKSISEAIPTDSQLNNYKNQAIIDRLNLLKTSFDIETLNNQVHRLEKITISENELKELLSLYYTPNIKETKNGTIITYSHIGKLKTLYDNVINYYKANIGSTDTSVISEINDHIAKYYDYIQINKTLIENSFELMRIGKKSDDQIVNYNGFSGVSIYNLKQGITTSKYFLDNNTFGYEYLSSFNFGVNSGTETNAFDFCFYAMQICSFLIVLFVIFFASSMISGEQNSGTLKMTATRPYTRNKIYSGKFFACINVSLILLLVSVVASMAVGIASYGFTMQNALIVVNASQVLVINPIVLMLIYIVSIFIDIVFYIALAILISMLIKPTTISTAITACIFIASTIVSGTTAASWIRFIPTTHLGLFKYFTTSNLGILSFSIVPGINLLISGLVVLISIVLFDLFGRYLLSHRNLDK